MRRTEILIRKNREWIAALALSLGLCGMACAEDAVPAAFPKGRYDAVKAHCPFAVATAQAPPAPVEAGFAANWFVSGIGRSGDNDFVTIKSRDQSKQFSLFGKDDEVDGVQLASVTWSDAVGKSTVVLKKGTETAKLEFNEAEIHAAPAAAAAGAKGAGAAPGAKTPGMNGKPPGMNLGQRTPPRLPTMPTTPAIGFPPGQPGMMPQPQRAPGTEIRRRPQVIQPPQN